MTKKEMVEQIAGKLELKVLVVKDVVRCFLDEVINEPARGNRPDAESGASSRVQS